VYSWQIPQPEAYSVSMAAARIIRAAFMTRQNAGGENHTHSCLIGVVTAARGDMSDDPRCTDSGTTGAQPPACKPARRSQAAATT